MKVFKKGFSIIELIIVIAILVLILAIILPKFGEIRDKQALDNAVIEAIGTLEKARSLSVSSLDSSEYGVYIRNNFIKIFKGQEFVDPTNLYETMSFISPSYTDNLSLIGSGGTSYEFYFKKISGVPSKYGSFRIKTTLNPNGKIINISPTGAIYATNP